MKYPNIGEKEIADSLLQKLAEILPDLKIEKMELAESKQSFLRYTQYENGDGRNCPEVFLDFLAFCGSLGVKGRLQLPIDT